MPIKSILVPYAGANAMASLQAALFIAKAQNAHVEILHARPGKGTLMPIFLPQPEFTGEILSELSSGASRHLETALSFCSSAVERSGIEMLENDEIVDAPSASVHIVEGILEKMLPLRARIADMVVLNLGIPGDAAHYGTVIRAALFRSGKPVLLVPHSYKMTKPVERAVVGWNGSFEAARALKLSLPMLAGAKVLVYTGVEGERPAITASEAATYLQRHGISAQAQEEPLDMSRDDAIREVVAEFGADLLVMGAFCREERVRETILGSFTSDVLELFNIPALMAN